MNFKKKISLFSMLCVLIMIFVVPMNAKAATLGGSLPNPESGCKLS